MTRRDYNKLRETSPLAGKDVYVHPVAGTEFEYLEQNAIFMVEDWYENVNGEAWIDSMFNGNFACILYGKRVVNGNLPKDNDVLYGHIGSLGYLIHLSEIGEEIHA